MRRIIFLAFFISLIVFIASALFFLSYFTPLSKSLFHASGTITEDLGGFDINSTALIFGSIALGGSSTRSILINNSYPFAIKVKLVLEGSISDKIIYSPIRIEPYKSSSFKMTFFSNLDDSLGDYDGNISVVLFRAGL